ncbi:MULTISPECIES: TIGR02680 family protein [unclassified Nocardia]|uniref:TIGR02680 family protein n=1 Tax=unclassified Nocardia TaxID=2637762 RepID=UPI001CE48A21|nr:MULTISPECIES: TIGR02680 family protein [unclassified Nocardia]
MSDLPTPARQRWQPLRAGLVDLFYYDVEEFHFHDGRLLLRGNNGTGKSKVLALTLPFLLDGELAAHRVEPDGDRNKRMEWNLLLGGKHPHTERLGYTWLEFGRLTSDGTPEYRTIGCGLKAVAGRGIARHWFFVTEQRVGHRGAVGELSLVGPTKVALTREKLKDALGGNGVYDTASDYRRAVDEALFGLGQHRYEALVNLLIQLRQPQLSKKPDEKLLSRALTEALPPLDPVLITTVAEAFRGLDEEREALRGLAEAKTAGEAFLGHYRRYARIAAKRRAEPPRKAHSRYEKLNSELAEAQSAFARAEAAVAAAVAEREAAGQHRTTLSARRDALHDSPEMRDAKALNQAKLDAERLGTLAADRERDLANAVNTLQRRESQLASARGMADADADAYRRATDGAARAAASAGLSAGHTEILEVLATDSEPYLAAQRAGDQLVDATHTALTTLAKLLDAADTADRAAQRAHDEMDRITGELQQAVERILEAEQDVTAAGAALVAEFTEYLRDARYVRVADLDTVQAALDAWVDTLDGPNPAATAVAEAVRLATAAVAREQQGVEAATAAAAAERDELVEEIARLEQGGHDAPPAPPTRDEAARRTRPGAPLWKVVDFTATVSDEQRAGLEAAVQAAGILDAWLDPDGTLRDGATDDVLIAPDTAAPDGGLTAVLTPAIDRADPQAAALDEPAVIAALGAIGFGRDSATTWVDTDGSFRIGVLRGSWHKAAAAYIGEGARETARRARLERLNAELQQVEARLETLAATAIELADRQEAIFAEQRRHPADTALRDAHSRVTAEHRARQLLDDKHAEAAAEYSRRATQAREVLSAATEFAQDVHLPADRSALAEVRTALGDYRVALAGLWPAARADARAQDAVRDAEHERELATDRRDEAVDAAGQARMEADGAAERHRTLVETAGTAVDELFRELAAVETEIAASEKGIDAALAAEQRAVGDRGRAEGQRETLSAQLDEVTTDRERTIAELRAFAATGLLATALPDLTVPDVTADWAPTPAVTLARAIDAELADLDAGERPWELIQQRVSAEHKLLTDTLSRQGHSVGLTVRDGIIVVDVRFQGRQQDVPGLVDALTAETEHRATLLSAKEREILENHLVNEVAGLLQELISGAEDQVRSINADLEARPTSTGMRLRLQWRTVRGAPEGLERVRERLLRQTADAWSTADRALVGAFLQEQINREHSDDTTGGGWTEQLTRALDYRSWHEFGIQRYQDGQWRPAAGPASGGERALVTSVPLFAAASSFYSSAGNPQAPRLVALDEAFAGVDDDSRAKCLGLLAAFDLDVVMTSEREWGCYPQVPGLAIAQLSRRDGIDAVLVTPWCWDGRERVAVTRPISRLPVSAPSHAEPAGGLF